MSNRSLQLRIWLLGLTRFELILRGKISRARGAFIRSCAQEYEKSGSVSQWIKAKHKQNIADILDAHYQAVIPHFGGMVLKQIKSRRITETKAKQLFSAFMLEWVKTESLRKARMISDTDSDDVRNAIQAGIEAGEGVAVIARNIRNVTSITPYRAATIARTETHNAATFGSVETARAAEGDLGIVLVKEWLSTKDDRTRPEHLAADGQQSDLGGRFEVGGESLDRPGDPSASPENVINCRCAVAFEEKQ